jgi:hypothetical protein
LGLRGTRYQGTGENHIIWSIIIYSPHQILLGDEIEKNEMGGTCNTYGVLWRNLTERFNLEEQSVYVRVILRCMEFSGMERRELD